MLGGLGPTELIIVLVIVLLVFGAGKLPDIASGLGKGLRDFKKTMREPEKLINDTSAEDTNDGNDSSEEKRQG